MPRKVRCFVSRIWRPSAPALVDARRSGIVLAGTFTETEEGTFPAGDIPGEILERVCQYMYYKLKYRNTPPDQIPEFHIPHRHGACHAAPSSVTGGPHLRANGLRKSDGAAGHVVAVRRILGRASSTLFYACSPSTSDGRQLSRHLDSPTLLPCRQEAMAAYSSPRRPRLAPAGD